MSFKAGRGRERRARQGRAARYLRRGHLGIAGLTVAGLGATLEAWRPLFLGLTFALMGWSFYEAFLRRTPAAASGCEASACDGDPRAACPPRRRSARWFFFGHVGLVIAVLLLPTMPGAASPAEGSDPTALHAANPELQTVSLTISGMTCMGCVRTIDGALNRLSGVQAATVTLEPGGAEVTIDPSATSVDAVVALIRAEGYEVTVLVKAEP